MSEVSGASPKSNITTPAEQVVKYRSKKKVHDTAVKVLDGKVTPGEIIKVDEEPVQTKRGPKPNILKDFNENPKRLDMAIYIQQGLSIEEAGILAGFSPEELKTLSERSDTYRRFVELQMIKFKQKHLKVISDKDNPSTSQWLLEQKFPETFGKKAKGGDGVGSTQVIQAIIKSVQMTPDETVIHEHDDSKKTKEKGKGHHQSLGSGDTEPTLEPGGANIL